MSTRRCIALWSWSVSNVNCRLGIKIIEDCRLFLYANEYLKDYISEMWRKIWSHDWSSPLYTQLNKQLWNFKSEKKFRLKRDSTRTPTPVPLWELDMTRTKFVQNCFHCVIQNIIIHWTHSLFWLAESPGGYSLNGLYRYVRPQRVWFFSRFGHK